MYPIRICRTKNMEIWELRLRETKQFFCYFSLINHESEKYLAVDIHSNVDLQNEPSIDYEDIITTIECLYEYIETNARISLHFYSINTNEFKVQEEDIYGDRTQQLLSYLNEVIKESCFKLVEKNMKVSLEKILNQTTFCLDI